MGDAERSSVDAERQVLTQCLGATQRSTRLTLRLGEVLENFFSLLGKPVWHPSCTEELLNNKILPCYIGFPTLGFLGDCCPKYLC